MTSPSHAMAQSLQTGPRGVLRSLLQRKGSSARSSRRVPVVLAVALALIACLAFGASSALAAAPTVTIDPTPTAFYTTAEVSGTVSTGGSAPLGYEIWRFEYSTEPANPSSWTPSNVGNNIFPPALEETTPIPVAGTIEGLQPGTTYSIRLIAEDFEDPPAISAEPNPTFTTEPVAEPSVTLNPVATHTGTTAHLSGTVNPNAPAGILSPAAKAAFKTEWHFECTPECPGLSGGTVQGEEGLQPVSVDATHLEPNTAYEVRLLASSAGGAPTAGPEAFSTDLITASVSTGPVGSDGHGGALLEGAVDPHNSEVSACHFQYGPTAAYGKEAPCVGTPGAANSAVAVNARLTGLTAGAAYHYRLTATNGAGPASSADASFIATSPSGSSAEACPNEAIREEQHSTFLPECRAYETWAPAQTNGQSMLPIQFTDGALEYKSNGNFAGGGTGAIGNAYLATRSATGWVTTALAPTGPTYEHEEAGGQTLQVSSDLRSSMSLDSRLGEPISLFLRDNATDTFTRVGIGGEAIPTIHGVSADLSHVVFGPTNHNSDFGPEYEFVGTGNEGPPRPVSVDNTGQPPPGNILFATISADGRVSVFTNGLDGTAPQQHVWARVGGTATVDASASECTRASSDPGGACDAPSNADFAGAAKDGSRVFFTTAQQLLNADANESTDLYACDIPSGAPTPVGSANPCDALTDITGGVPDARFQQVMTISEDGSHVYFTAQGVLAANADYAGQTAQAGDENLYLWQNDANHPGGEITFVANSNGQGWSTPDGRYLVLATAAALLPTDTDGVTDFYRYDSETGQMIRVSTGVSGVGGNSPEGAVTDGPAATKPMSADTSVIVFETSEALSPSDTNGEPSIYAWHNGQVSLIAEEGGLIGITPSGSDIYFGVGHSFPGSSFYFGGVDARIDGGFAADHSVSCSGEACQPAVSGAPTVPGAPPSTAPSGEGNLAAVEPAVPVKKPTKPPTRAQKLAKALKTCRKDRSKHKRAACEAQARRRYGAKHKAKSPKGVR